MLRGFGVSEDLRLWKGRVGVFAICCLAALAVAHGPTTGSFARAESTEGSGNCMWNRVPSPSRQVYNELSAIKVLSPDDVWAVGSSGDRNFGDFTLIEHWNGTAWSIVPSPDPGSDTNSLRAVDGVSPEDLWAVGSYDSGGNLAQPLALHWDGTAWSQVDVPGLNSLRATLSGLVVISAGDVWAAGYTWGQGGGIAYRTLLLHWDGTAWTQVPSPNAGTWDDRLTSISAVSAGDIWVAGRSGRADGIYQPLVEHFDGTTWSIVPLPSVDPVNGFLNGISAAASNDIWAAGYTCPANCPGFSSDTMLSMHWDGAAWSVVDNAPLGGDASYLNSIVALSGGEAWAVGERGTTGPGGTITIHREGGAWAVVPSETSATDGEYEAVVALPGDPNRLWAVGFGGLQGASLFATLAVTYTGPCGGATPTPAAATSTPTATSATLTQTRTPVPPSITPVNSPTGTPTQTPVATPRATSTSTPCAIAFSDVHPGDYFYDAVAYLYCHGSISGYADGTFRPYSDTTRGQLSKIVALAEGWPLATPTAATFTDVPVGSPFFPYVETAYAHNIISGYSCGVGCLEFRPSNNATRAQLTKIIALARGWAITPPQQPTFRDVPLGDPFFGYVETAYSHSIISGYSCGQGCLEFRPGNNATRGQIARIVYNAITGP